MLNLVSVESFPGLPTPTAESSPSRSAPHLLLDALRGLAAMGASRSVTRGRRVVRHYRDAEYQYIDAALPELEGVEADICIHDGRVYVRLAR